jgi:hypothetical protein
MYTFAVGEGLAPMMPDHGCSRWRSGMVLPTVSCQPAVAGSDTDWVIASTPGLARSKARVAQHATGILSTKPTAPQWALRVSGDHL